MAKRKKSDRVAEYGDFQTPVSLARAVCRLLSRRGVSPAAVVEPTCGRGNLLLAALDEFPNATRAVGLDVNRAHVEAVRWRLRGRSDRCKVETIVGDFFNAEWSGLLRSLPDPVLVIGNPPWVTNTELGTLRSSNLPEKANFKRLGGLDALTGKSNFDISEWMLLEIMRWLDGRNATMAMLCKTVVARKVLAHAWKHKVGLSDAEVYLIDANASFNASVDACLLLCTFASSSGNHESLVYASITDGKPVSMIGYRDGRLIADLDAYHRWKHLEGPAGYRWRSGIKHDCAKVMELRKEGQRFRNGFHELVELEDEYVYPMLKGSEIAKARIKSPRGWLIVTQQSTGEDTSVIRRRAPKTWEYLQSHAERLDRRASSIYRNRPQFSIFGVGDYSFAPWKVAISGLYKRLAFTSIGSFAGKPIVVDDTCCFVSCAAEAEATFVASLLNSPGARAFLSAFIFWDAKRPITIDVLQRLDLAAVARELGCGHTLSRYLSVKPEKTMEDGSSRGKQLSLFDGS